MFFLMTLRILFCWSISREMLSGKSSESTTPLTKPKYSGMMSSQLSMMKTRRTYNLMLFAFFLPSNIERRAWDEQDRLELQLTLDGEVLHGELFLVVGGATCKGMRTHPRFLPHAHPDRLACS